MEKRVLFVTLSLAGGGAERVVSILSSELAEQGRDVHLILYDRKNNEYPLSSKVKLQELSRPIGSNPLSRLFNRVIELRRIIKEITPDIVIPFLAKPTEHVFFATRGMRLKFIATVRNNPKLYPSNSGLRYVVNWITRHSDAIMLQTAEQASYFKTESDRVFVVSNPVKQEMVDTQYQYKTSIHTIATFGRLNEQKNHELLINAFSVFCKRYPEFELNIWGEGEKKSVLEKLICDKKMSDKIHLCGNTSKVKDELLNTDIFVLSSNYEGLPNSLMEAMAVGVPVISTDCPTGPKDLITNKENGILVKSNSVDELVNALKLLASDYQLRKYIGQNAKKYMKNFTASEIARGFLEGYQLSLKISKSQINTMLLYASAVLILIKMLTRLNNGAWELSYANVYTYNFYGSNLYGEANDWSLYILLFFFIINAKDCLLRQKDFFYVIICIGSFAFWTVIELMKGSGNYVFRGSIPTTLCLIPLFFLYGSARGVREQIKNLSAFLTIGFLAITVISSIQTYGSLGYGVRILSSPAKDSLSVAMLSLWVYVFADTANNVRKREYYFKIILISIATVCSIAIISRSWTIQCFILLVAYMLVSSEDSTQFTRVIKISIVVGVLLLVLSLNFENLINSLLGRVGEDTRSGQYEQFFSQVKMTSLIFGNGMNATYKFNGQKYSYFDNQIIFTSFHYGIVSFFVLAIFLLRVILCRVKDCYNNIMRKELVQKKIVTVLLVAALCGLSVYLKYDWTVPWALILIYLGSYEQNSI